MKKRTKIITFISCSLVAAIGLALAIPFTIFGIKSASIKNDYSYLKNDPIYSQKTEVKNVELVKQHISCGYASIEMISAYYGNKVTEDELDARNGSISTSTSRGFLNEINNSIPTHEFVMHTYLKADMLLKEICVSLRNNNPVALEWAAKFEDEWTLHFSVITALDLSKDNVTIYNPYGYVENLTVGEFVDRANFEAYENMPGFLNFGFAYGAFNKNTIFYSL